jgi:prevent-host-death family protein
METKQVKTDEARRNLRELLNAVEHGGAHVTVLRYNRPSVVLVPVDWYTRAQWALADGDEKP